MIAGAPRVTCMTTAWSLRTWSLVSQNFVDAVPADLQNDALLVNWTKPGNNPIVNGSGKDPSAAPAWQTADRKEWRFSTNAATIFTSTDFRSWKPAGKLASLPEGDCPSLLPLPRTTGRQPVKRRRRTHRRTCTSHRGRRTGRGCRSGGTRTASLAQPARGAGRRYGLQPHSLLRICTVAVS